MDGITLGNHDDARISSVINAAQRQVGSVVDGWHHLTGGSMSC